MKMPVLSLSFCFLLFTYANAQNNLGLVADLTEIKLYSEGYAHKVFNDSLLMDSASKDTTLKSNLKHFHDQYNKIRISYEKVLLQLTADIRLQGRPRRYRRLDAIIKEANSVESIKIDELNEYIKAYVKELQGIHSNYARLKNLYAEIYSIPIRRSGGIQTFFEGADVASLITLGATIIKDIKTAQVEKAEKIALMLLELRLKPIQELGKPEKKEEEEKS